MKVNTIALRLIHLIMILLIVFCPQTQVAASIKVEVTYEKPQNELELYQKRFLEYQQKCPEQFQYFCFDDMLDLIDELEYGEPEESRTEEELDEVFQFFAFLADEGISPDDTENRFALAADIYDFMNDGYVGFPEWICAVDDGIVISPAVFNDNWEIVLCKNYFSKKWKKTKKFVKKHKKAILIGAVVVVAVTVVVVAAVAISSAAATTAATASVGAIGGSAKQSSPDKESASTNDPPLSDSPAAVGETEPILSPLEEGIAFFKEQSRDSDVSSGADTCSLINEMREFTSYLVHDVVDAVAELAECVPQAIDGIRDRGKKIFSDGPTSGDFLSSSASDTFGEKIVSCHEAVDDFFSTDFSAHYNTEDIWAGCSATERAEAEAFLSNLSKSSTPDGFLPLDLESCLLVNSKGASQQRRPLPSEVGE